VDTIEKNRTLARGLPQIWRIGIGVSSYFPFYAAGNYPSSSAETTLSRAVSSYVLTFRVLAFVREQVTSKMTESNRQILLLLNAIPMIPVKAALLAAEDEIGAIRDSVQPEFTVHQLN
jgi:hypothetical protein